MCSFTVGSFEFSPVASTQCGEWCEMPHGENWGGGVCDDNDAFARVYNNLSTLVHCLLNCMNNKYTFT